MPRKAQKTSSSRTKNPVRKKRTRAPKRTAKAAASSAKKSAKTALETPPRHVQASLSPIQQESQLAATFDTIRSGEHKIITQRGSEAIRETPKPAVHPRSHTVRHH